MRTTRSILQSIVQSIVLTSTLILGCSAAVGALGVVGLDEPAPQNTRRLWIPFDHGRPEEGSFLLQYAFGRPFDPESPTVFVISDALEGAVPPDSLADMQERVFGPAMNVVTISPRGGVKELLGQLRPPEGGTDWAKSWRYLKAAQWVEDIETVRRTLLGEREVFMFGRGSGGFLMHQYVARHGEHVRRILSLAAATPYLDAELGIEIHGGDAVPGGEAGETRSAIASRVRRFELALPTMKRHVQKEPPASGEDAEDDLADVPAEIRPLVLLDHQGKISPAAVDVDSLDRFDVEALVLVGCRDRSADLRSQAAFAARYRQAEFLLVDDDHTLSSLEDSELYPPLVRTFFLQGLHSSELRKVFKDLQTRALLHR